MQDTIVYVGCDVHKDTITVAVAEAGSGPGHVISTIANTPAAVTKLMRRLAGRGRLAVWYEAGPCGYVLQRHLTQLGIACQVAAPSLIPTRAGDRVKTDRRDALRLAELARSGLLTAVRVPDETDEALRDVVRARGQTREDVTRLRQRIGKLLLRLGVRPPHGERPWTLAYRTWLERLRLPQPGQERVLSELRLALGEAEARLSRLEAAMVEQAATSALADLVAAYQALRGVEQVTAITLVAELGDLSRFDSPRQAMAYLGLVPSEHSSGGARRQGGITKTGNARARHVVIEAAHHARHRPRISRTLARRQQGLEARIVGIAWQAQQRLHRRYWHLLSRGKDRPVVVAAIGRELVGFLWAIAREVTRVREQRMTAGAVVRAA